MFVQCTHPPQFHHLMFTRSEVIVLTNKQTSLKTPYATRLGGPGIATPLHTSPYGPLRPNVTSSIKPEVHNVSQRRQSRTESRQQGICTKMYRSVERLQIYAHRQTDRHTQTHEQTDKLIAIFRSLPRHSNKGYRACLLVAP